jgi:hypothetical protein
VANAKIPLALLQVGQDYDVQMAALTATKDHR